MYSRNNLPKIKYEANVVNLDESKSVGTYWIVINSTMVIKHTLVLCLLW